MEEWQRPNKQRKKKTLPDLVHYRLFETVHRRLVFGFIIIWNVIIKWLIIYCRVRLFIIRLSHEITQNSESHSLYCDCLFCWCVRFTSVLTGVGAALHATGLPLFMISLFTFFAEEPVSFLLLATRLSMIYEALVSPVVFDTITKRYK